jgi:meso-butanediol dehydrogenase/(S,S)-butanediol dehydrogenase/diacetyl reductase
MSDRSLKANGTDPSRARLDGRVAIVTGAAGGIGRATALRLAADGAQLVVNDVREPELAETLELIGGSDHIATAGDVSLESTAAELAVRALERFGRIDILVNNAGVQFVRDITDTTVEDFDRVIGVNVRSMALCAKHALPPMLESRHGSIINVGSASSFTGQEHDGVSTWLYNVT